MSYDSRAVKVSKTVKRIAAMIPNAESRNHLIRLHVKLLSEQAHTRSARNKGN